MLDQSYRWGCKKMRTVALEHLKALPMDPVLKIAVWKKYGLDEADIATCYHALATRLKPLTVEEGRQLELETTLKLTALRDRVQQGVLNFMKDPASGGGAFTTERIRDLVCRAFLVDFMKS